MLEGCAAYKELEEEDRRKTFEEYVGKLKRKKDKGEKGEKGEKEKDERKKEKKRKHDDDDRSGKKVRAWVMCSAVGCIFVCEHICLLAVYTQRDQFKQFRLSLNVMCAVWWLHTHVFSLLSHSTKAATTMTTGVCLPSNCCFDVVGQPSPFFPTQTYLFMGL